jgi:NAD(P)-dependent dehydrogenase (short-subunit alcohol dehydrogenase family)
MQTLENQNVVVIGGTSGIGLATANAAAEQGANVWAASRSESTIDKARRQGHEGIKFSQVDTHDIAGLAELFAEVGTIDHLVRDP